MKPKAIYCDEVMKRWGNLPAVLVLGATLLIVGLAVSTWSVRRFHAAEYATFREKSTRLTGVFARAAGGWISKGQLDVLESMADVTLAGSGQYVWVAFGDRVLLDKRMDDPEIQELVLPLETNLAEATIESAFRDAGLDVVYPFSIPGQPGSAAGIVRIGFSDLAARNVVRKHQVIIFGSFAGSWSAVMLLAAILCRLDARRRRSQDEYSMTVPSGVIEAGALRIDTDTCEVRLGERLIDLTPKMFDLLAFLAREPGKTHSDEALLEALWSDSAYAASNDVKQCVYMLRKRLKAGHPAPKNIVVNVKGFGYKLVPPDESVLKPD